MHKVWHAVLGKKQLLSSCHFAQFPLGLRTIFCSTLKNMFNLKNKLIEGMGCIFKISLKGLKCIS